MTAPVPMKSHVPVLLDEVVTALAPVAGGRLKNTLEPELLPSILAAAALPAETRAVAAEAR